MTALILERLVYPGRSATPRFATVFAARITMIGESIRAARALDNVVSPGAQKRVMERFASSTAY